jgi:hypothetical protein
MKDESSDDACRNGEDSAPPPIRENAKGKYHQASQYSDFDKDRSHEDRSHKIEVMGCQSIAKLTAWAFLAPAGSKFKLRHIPTARV